MRIVFMGSPDFALPALRRLIASEHDVVAVFTQPDRPVGRGRKMLPPPVKTLALQHGLLVLQPRSISKPASVDRLRELRPDIGVIAAYGQILKQPVLDVPRLGILNVHASLLPRWRGAAPIPAAILAGDAVTGATIMRVELALDAGPMLAKVEVGIGGSDTTATLTPRVAEAGAELLMPVLPQWADGSLHGELQDDALATYAPQIEKGDALIRWERDSAVQIERVVRAYNPWPMAYGVLDGQALRIVQARVLDDAADPGRIVGGHGDAAVAVGTRERLLGIVTLQPPGGRAMPSAAYLNGHRDIIGKRFDLTAVD
jgi:methionyl-tRNA formyltransferase